MMIILIIIINSKYKWLKYTKVNVQLSDSQLKKLKDAVSNNTGTTLRISLKMFNGKST